MVNLKLKLITDFKNESKRDSIGQNEYLNLPDLQFFLWCNTNFRLNRGVYNTIDSWLFNYGITNIISRRIFFIAFLNFVSDSSSDQGNKKYLRFGNGGLTRKLQQFMEKTENVVH